VSRKKVFWISATVVVAVFFVEALIVRDYFSRPIPTLAQKVHPVFWRPRITAPYIFTQLDSAEYVRAERAGLYFHLIPGEMETVREKMLQWVNGEDEKRRLLSYKYFSRENMHGMHEETLSNRSCIAEKNHSLFIEAWDKEINLMCLGMLAEMFFLSDIPVQNLSTDTKLKAAFVEMILVLRSNDKGEIASFQKRLENINARDKKAVEIIMNSVAKEQKDQPVNCSILNEV